MTGSEHTIKDDDHELVLSCKKGNNKHQKRMLNIAYRVIGDYEEACEAVQDAFLSAFRNIRNFEGKARFSTWLFTIVTNVSRNRIKQLRGIRGHECFSLDNPVLTDEGTILVESASGEPSVLEGLEKKDIQRKVQTCIDSLEQEFREVVVLRDIEGFSYDEIGKMLEIAGGTVKSRLFRARDALRDCLKKVLGEL
jgi:RNA polymerase sigma-70 factor (ECF subfamily)